MNDLVQLNTSQALLVPFRGWCQLSCGMLECIPSIWALKRKRSLFPDLRSHDEISELPGKGSVCRPSGDVATAFHFNMRPQSCHLKGNQSRNIHPMDEWMNVWNVHEWFNEWIRFGSWMNSLKKMKNVLKGTSSYFPLFLLFIFSRFKMDPNDDIWYVTYLLTWHLFIGKYD